MIQLVRTLITKITDVVGGIRLFTGSGREGETFEDMIYIQQAGFISFPNSKAQGLVMIDGQLAILIATDDSDRRPPGVEDERYFYFDKTNYVKWDPDGNFELTTTKKITVNATGNAVVTASKVSIKSGEVNLGNGTLKKLLTEDFTTGVHDTHFHTSGGPGSPSSPPVTPGGSLGQTADTKGS